MKTLTPFQIAAVVVSHQINRTNDPRLKQVIGDGLLVTAETFGGAYCLYADFETDTMYVTRNGVGGIAVYDVLTGGGVAARQYVGISLIRDYWVGGLMENGA